MKLSSKSDDKKRKKKSRKKSRDRIKDIKLTELYGKGPTTDVSSAVDTDIWGIEDCRRELKEAYILAAKCHTVRRRSLQNQSAIGSKTMVGQVQKWRQSRLKSQLSACLSRVVPRLGFIEESIRLWLEAVVMRKWSVRYDALTLLNELDASIALHEYRLDCIDDRMDECKELAVTLKTQCNLLASMMIFHECVLEEARREALRVAGTDPTIDSHDDDEDDEPVFQGYTAPAAGMPLSPKALSSNPLVHLYKEGYQDYKRSRTRSECLDTEGVHADIAKKFEESIELINCCNNLQDSIRANRSKEMVAIAIATKTKTTLKQLCGFSSVGSGGGDDIEGLFPKDGRRFYCTSSNDSGGDITRGAVGDVMTNKSSQKRSLRAVKDCIDHLQMLSFQEGRAKDALVKVIELKNEIAEMDDELDLHESEKPTSSSPHALVYDIVWGANSVPVPSTDHSGKFVFCRNGSCYKEFNPHPKDDSTTLDEATTSLEMSMQQQQETAGLKDLIFTLKLAGVSSDPADTTPPVVYLKEFTVGELSPLLAQLQAGTLRVHSIKDRFSSDWFGSHTAVLDAVSSLPESSSRDSISKPEQRDSIFDQISAALSQPFLRFDSDISGVDDTTTSSFPVGCGLLWDERAMMSYGLCDPSGCLIPVGISGCVGVFASSSSYQNILCALSLRDYISTEIGTHLPVVVYLSSSKSFIGMNVLQQHCVVRDFLRDCTPHRCTCSAPCNYPAIPPDCPPGMRLTIENYYNLKASEKARIHGAWSTNYSFLKELYPTSLPFEVKEVAKHLLYGLSEAVASANVRAAKEIVGSATFCLIKAPELRSLGKFDIESEVQPDCGTSTKEGPVAPLEDFVQHVSSLVVKYESPVSMPVPHAELMVPLGAVRIVLAAVNKQTNERVDEACIALARWIDLSSSVAFRIFGSVHTPVAEVASASTSDIGDSITASRVFENEPSHDPKMPPLAPVGVGDKKRSLESIMRRRIPLLGSVTVSCRTELYHDLMSAQISATEGRAYNETIFNSDLDSGGTYPTRRSREFTRQSTTRASEYNFKPDEQIDLLLHLCRHMCTLAVDCDKKSSSRGSASLQSVRNELRFHVLQYLLGLDERWSFDHTAEVCMFVLERVEEYRSIVHSSPECRGDILFNFGPFNLIGRASKLLNQSSVNVIARGFPASVLGLNCNIRYSLDEDGATLMSLNNAIQSKSYKACMLVIQDTMGHVFGGFINGEFQTQSKQYFGSGDSFVFRALPSTKIYPWTHRNDFFAYFSNTNIGMGGGGAGFAFMLNEDMSQGTSAMSDTYGNSVLSFTEQFSCVQFEFWTFEDALT